MAALMIAFLRRRPLVGVLSSLLMLVALVSLPSLLSWQQLNENRTVSLSHLRRLVLAAQLYAQDYDDRLMPSSKSMPAIRSVVWTDRIAGYGAVPDILDNPANSVEALIGPVMDPVLGCRVISSYAINRRFYDVFSKGPFLLDNLELPAQTALFVEAGPMWSATGRESGDHADPHRTAFLEYDDTTERYNRLVPYPSSHGGRIAIAALDGHATTVRVAHYGASDGPHDRLYGRIGGDIYNWNGGRPNGKTDLPPKE